MFWKFPSSDLLKQLSSTCLTLFHDRERHEQFLGAVHPPYEIVQSNLALRFDVLKVYCVGHHVLASDIL